MKITAESRSDQWNADDFLGGPRTFVIAGATDGKAEAAFDIQFQGEEKVWRPPVTVRKILTAAWGDESDEWIGRRVTLYRDATIRFGPSEVGGVRLSHMSHIDGPVKAVLNQTRGKRALHTVQPLKDFPATAAPTAPTAAQVSASTSTDELRAWWHVASPERKAQIEARVTELGKEQS
jgi:hypothetical protein